MIADWVDSDYRPDGVGESAIFLKFDHNTLNSFMKQKYEAKA